MSVTADPPSRARLDNVRSIVIIDDAFVPLADADLAGGGADELYAAIEADEKIRRELDDLNVSVNGPEDVTADLLEQLAQPGTQAGYLYAAAIPVCGRLAERRDMLLLVERLESQFDGTVQTFAPAAAAWDASQVVFLDYYLEGTRSANGGTLARDIAQRIARPADGSEPPLLVLMSSDPSVQQFKDEFRAGVAAYEGGFVFVSKMDMDEPWKVRAHLELLDGARPRAAVVHAYASSLTEAVVHASADLLGVLHSLDLADYSYLHNIALLGEGQPLGQYLTWLFSNHLTHLVFERALRAREAAVDRIAFGSVLMTPTAPSLRVADLYQSALFEQNVGELDGHPLDAAKEYDVPMLRLGDVFVSTRDQRAYVVLSAACDLAFAPAKGRAPDPAQSIIIVPGALRDVRSGAEGAGTGRTDYFRLEQNVYEIDWDFGAYVARPRAEISAYLNEAGCNVGPSRVRFRPLYALKLQAEFAAKVLRVGAPVAPPALRAVRSEVWCCVGDEAELVRTFTNGESVIYPRKGQTYALVSLEVATVLQQAVIRGMSKAEAALGAINPDVDAAGHVRKQKTSDVERLAKARDDSGCYEGLVSRPVLLPAAGKGQQLGKGALHVVLNGDPKAVSQGKACVVWRLLDAEVAA